jgi:predicted nucleic acid-binding protein
MNVADALQNVNRLFLDTAAIIYYVEQHPHYFTRVKPFFDQVDSGLLEAVTSPVTLAECLVVPARLGQAKLQQDFQQLIIWGNNTLFVTLDHRIGVSAADLRAHYNFTLPDALQLAVAIQTGCQAFLTNDTQLKRTTELRVLILSEITV